MKDAHDRVRYAMLGLLLGAGLGTAAAASDDANQAQALAERRQKMIEQCMRDRGSKEDCEKQADAELGVEAMDRQHSEGGGRRRGGR
jgi:hypothetical protein